MLSPTSQMRTLRALEPPSPDEGFTRVERVPFERMSPPDGQASVLVAAGALTGHGWQDALEAGDRISPHLVFDWNPDGDRSRLEAAVRLISADVSGPVEGALCPHPAGPPTCWCRPPLPGLPLAFARSRGVNLSRSILIGASPAHRTLARALGARYIQL